MPVTDKNFNGVKTGTGYVTKTDNVGANQIINIGANPNGDGLQLVTDTGGGVIFFAPLAPNSVGKFATHYDPPVDCYVWSTMNGTAFG